MTTDPLEHDDPTPASAAARLGALAATTPIVMFLAWAIISGGIGTSMEFLLALCVGSGIAVVAGWVVGSRTGSSVRGSLFGAIAYVAVGWLVALPVGAIWSTWARVKEGTVSGPADVLASMGFLLLYGLVSSLYVIPLLTPFGAGWALTNFALRRAMRV